MPKVVPLGIKHRRACPSCGVELPDVVPHVLCVTGGVEVRPLSLTLEYECQACGTTVEELFEFSDVAGGKVMPFKKGGA